MIDANQMQQLGNMDKSELKGIKAALGNLSGLLGMLKFPMQDLAKDMECDESKGERVTFNIYFAPTSDSTEAEPKDTLWLLPVVIREVRMEIDGVDTYAAVVVKEAKEAVDIAQISQSIGKWLEMAVAFMPNK